MREALLCCWMARCVVAGDAPDQEAVLRLAEWLDTKQDQNLFASSYLEGDLEWTKEIADVASGLLAIRISDVRRSYVMWFRPEIVRTVHWAGEPLKVADERLTFASSKVLRYLEREGAWAKPAME